MLIDIFPWYITFSTSQTKTTIIGFFFFLLATPTPKPSTETGKPFSISSCEVIFIMFQLDISILKVKLNLI